MRSYYFLIIIFFLTTTITTRSYTNEKNQKPILFGGYIDGKNIITVVFNKEIDTFPSKDNFVIKDNYDKIVHIKKITKCHNKNELIIITRTTLDIKNEYFLTFDDVTKRLVLNNIYLNKDYYNLSIKLGAICNSKKTIFRIFAPRAKSVKVRIYSNPIMTQNEYYEEKFLKRIKGGVWELTINQDLHKKYYTYLIESVGTDCHPDLEIVDPYAKIVTRGDGVNVIRKNEKQPFDQTLGRAMIVDMSRTEKVEKLKLKNNKIDESIIWEVHLRDFTRGNNSGVPDNIKGTYLGAAYRGSKYKNFSTALDHIIELGINTVHFLPLNEFVVGNEFDYKHKYINYNDQKDWPNYRYYDWGYGPINYFSPEGYYSTNPDDLSRINELKRLISEFHRNGIKVIFDVVFNHTFEGSRNSPNIYSLRAIDADYYYRSMADGTFYDGIFCQNEIKTENPMVSKLILDCLEYWVREFKVDGFRFDWMSAYDPDNLAIMIKKLRKINPNILLYGELWTLRGLSYKGKNTGTYLDRQHIGLFEKDYNLPSGSIAAFNDYFRDAIKGSGFMRDYAGGYIQNTINDRYYPNSEKGHQPYQLARKVITGMINYSPLGDDPTEWQNIRSPLNSINYIDCHDGYTLFDKLIISNYCNFQEPGKQNSPKSSYPKSDTNPNVVDFFDKTQFPEENIKHKIIRMNNLGAAILLTSQGIPFLHAGQEILRQKINYVYDSKLNKYFYVFDDNSNTSSDETNSIKWENKETYYDIFNYYKGLIKLRKEHPTFRRTSKESVINGLKFHDEWLPDNSERCIAYNLLDDKNQLKNEKWKNVIVLINPYNEKKTFKIPEGKWAVVVNGDKAGTEILYYVSGSKITVDPISLMVLYKTN